VLAAKAVDFIKQSAGQPFAIEVATFSPHAPYTPAPRDANAFPDLRAPRTPAFNAAAEAGMPQWLNAHRALTDADMAGIDRDFRKRAQSVQAVDKMIGELEDAVAAIGEANNTYFVFSSDNGYHMGEHRLMPGKMTAFDTDIHVPLVVTGPGIAPGRVVQEIADNIDLNPTFTEIGGAATAATVDGRSLVPLLHGRPVTEWRKAALVEHHGHLKDASDPDFPGKRGANPPSYEAIRGLMRKAARRWTARAAAPRGDAGRLFAMRLRAKQPAGAVALHGSLRHRYSASGSFSALQLPSVCSTRWKPRAS
jgi:arylsulfatase A-like enzyme